MFTHTDFQIETVFILAAAALLLRLVQRRNRQRTGDSREHRAGDDLHKMARIAGAIEYEIFQKSAAEWPVSETAVRFEAGSPNTTGQAALHASAGLLLDYGMERVASAILQNTERLMTELVRIDGIRLNSRTAPARRSGIVSFGHETLAPGTLYQGLRERGISCALREGGVRVSPHFYQGEPELTVFLDALAHIA